MWIVWLVIAILDFISLWKIFDKANVPGWFSLIPFFNLYNFFKITTGNGWDMLYCFIPVFGQVYFIYVHCSKLSQVFGYKVKYTIGLFFLPTVFRLILGFNSSKYEGYSDKEPTDSIAALYLIGGISSILFQLLFCPFKPVFWVPILSTGILFIIIGISGLSVVHNNSIINKS